MVEAESPLFVRAKVTMDGKSCRRNQRSRDRASVRWIDGTDRPLGIRRRSAVSGPLLRKPNNRDRSMCHGRFTTICGVGRKHAVRHGPQPLSVSFVVHDSGSHRDSTEDDSRMGSDVVIPGRVLGTPGVRGNDYDPVTIVKVDDRMATQCAASRPLCLQHGCGKDKGRGQSAMAHSQEDRIELPSDCARQIPGEARRGQCCVHASEHAGRPSRVDTFEADGQCGNSPLRYHQDRNLPFAFAPMLLDRG